MSSELDRWAYSMQVIQLAHGLERFLVIEVLPTSQFTR